MIKEDNMGINSDSLSSDFLNNKTKNYKEQLEVRTLSFQHEKVDGEQRETSMGKHEPVITKVVTMPTSTSSLATKALMTLASQRSNVTAFEATHTTANLYPCTICGKLWFTQHEAMMQHIYAIHDKRKDVKCPH